VEFEHLCSGMGRERTRLPRFCRQEALLRWGGRVAGLVGDHDTVLCTGGCVEYGCVFVFCERNVRIRRIFRYYKYTCVSISPSECVRDCT